LLVLWSFHQIGAHHFGQQLVCNQEVDIVGLEEFERLVGCASGRF
jgi:hypothetical protein